MPAIRLTSVSFSFTSEPLLDGVTLTVAEGERACLVGPNGCGKTTLLRLVAGGLVPDSGTVQAPLLAPVPDAAVTAGSVGDYLDAATASVRSLTARFETVAERMAAAPEDDALARSYDELLAAMTAVDAWGLQARIEETLVSLGLGTLSGPDARTRRLATLSPGQRGRLTLAATLLTRPAALVLDEPTNHLDDEAVAYLAAALRGWEGPVLLASHDRAFIDDVATCVLDLDTAPWQALLTATGGGRVPGVQRCAGAYSDYLENKARARASHDRIHASQQEDKRALARHRRESETIGHYGTAHHHGARTEGGMAKKFYADRTSQASMRRRRDDDRRLEALGAVEVRRPRSYRLSLDLPRVVARSGSGLAVAVREAHVPGRLAPVTFDLSAGEHLLVTGPNGCGKTTLLRWVATGSPPTAESTGALTVSGGVAVIPQRLPRPGDPGLGEETWASGIGEAGAGILHPAYWSRCVGELSAGNQRRAQFAAAVAAAPEVLIVDEPTNYLDLDTMEALEAALTAWGGALLVASHDRWLIDHWDGPRLRLMGEESGPRRAGTSRGQSR